MTLDETIAQVKLAKAENAFDLRTETYGSLQSNLRSLDCNSREEAVRMLAHVQSVKIYKRDGKVVVE